MPRDPGHRRALARQISRVINTRRGRRVGLCGACQRPVMLWDEHVWVRGKVFHRRCT